MGLLEGQTTNERKVSSRAVSDLEFRYAVCSSAIFMCNTCLEQWMELYCSGCSGGRGRTHLLLT